MKLTSSLANKLLQEIRSDKEVYLRREEDSCIYTVAEGEEPCIPEYDFLATNKAIEELNKKERIIKHALHIANLNSQIEVQGEFYSVDEILIEIAQLSSRERYYNRLRTKLKKERTQERRWGEVKCNAIEYRYINYDLEDAKKEFAKAQERIFAMQLALDLYNETVTFDVDIEM